MTYIKYLPFYLLSLLPMWGLYLLSDFFYVLLYYIVGYRKKVVRTNLRNSFPEIAESELKRVEAKFYRNLCSVFVELIKVLTMSRAQARRRYQVKNPELLEEYWAAGRNAIVYAGHHGNWEWMGLLPLHLSYKILAFYQRQSSSYFNHLMLMIRQRYGVHCFESDKGFKTIIQYRNDGVNTMTLMLGDQSPKGDSTRYWTSFLNQETAFLTGTSRIARKTNSVVVFPKVHRIKRGYYQIEFILLDDNPNDSSEFGVIDAYAKELDRVIHESPELWLWSHKRWKLAPGNGKYDRYQPRETNENMPTN